MVEVPEAGNPIGAERYRHEKCYNHQVRYVEKIVEVPEVHTQEVVLALILIKFMI